MSKVFTIIDGLENMGAIRTGGQGSVYKARRLGPILSAVKLLPTPIFAEDANDKNYNKFLNEVEKLRKVNEAPNPNVVKILSSGITESGSLPFIEMEYIEGPDLGELLAAPHDRIFKIKEVIKVAEQLAGALAHCHNVGVKHGDIKSNNVKFNVHSGNYVLLDFGLSIMSDEERRSSMRHAGAIEFMAPEQNEGKMLFQTDVYSYGVILYELLAGRVPFPLHDNGETARNTVMIAHMESPVPDLLELRRKNLPGNWTAEQKDREMHIPAWLLYLIGKCLEKSPESRYQSGIDLQEALAVNSVLTERTVNDALDVKSNDKALQHDLPKKSAALIDRSGVVMPISLFRVAIGVIVISLIFGAYGLFSNKVVYYPVTSRHTPIMLLKPYDPYINTIKPADSAQKPRNRVTASAKKKHKRKKFLGIF